MKTLASSISMAIIITGLLTFGSCRKKEKEKEIITKTETTDTEQNTTTDNNLAENIVSDIESMGSQVAENSSLTTFKMTGGSSVSGAEALAVSPCATVSGIGSQTITVDFGTFGCLGTDGRVRTGKLIYDFSASTPTSSVHYRNPGFAIHVT